MDKQEAAQALNVSKEATIEEVKKAFRHKSKMHHPDKGGNPEVFNKLRLAHDILLGKEDPKMETSQAMTELLSAFQVVIDRAHNPFTIDLMAKTKQFLLEQKSQLQSQIKNIEADLHITSGILERLNCTRDNDFIGNMLRGHIAGAESALSQVSAKILNIEEAINLTKDYSYNVDPGENNFSTGVYPMRYTS
jgi:hypothetical protein